MSDNQENFDDQIRLLIRTLRTERFRFIIIQYNHFDVIRKIKEILSESFPDRKIYPIEINETFTNSDFKPLAAIKSGIVYIERFEQLLNNNDLAHGFNQRRDQFSKSNVQFIAFLPEGGKTLQLCAKKIPDFWSLRNLILNLFIPIENIQNTRSFLETKGISSIGGQKQYKKRKELTQLLDRIKGAKKENPELVNNLYKQAIELYKETGDYKKGLYLSREWIDYLTKIQAAPQQLVSPKVEIGFFLKKAGDFEGSRSTLKAMLLNAEKLGWKGWIPSLRNDLALVLQDLGDYEEAKVLLEKVTVSDEKNFGVDFPATAVSYSNLAIVLQNLGEYEEAKVLLEKATKSNEKNFGVDHPTTLSSYSNLALVLQDLGDYYGAKTILERVAKSNEKNFGVDHPTTAGGYSNLAMVLREIGDFQEAKTLLEKAITTDEKSFSVDHPSTSVCYSNLATVLRDLGDYQGAKTLLEKTIRSDEKNFGIDHPSTARSYSNLASVLLDLGDFNRAKKLFETSYTALIKQLGENHPNTKIVKGNLEKTTSLLNKKDH